MKLKDLLEILNCNVYFHLFKEKHIGRFDKFDIGVEDYLDNIVKEINIDDEDFNKVSKLNLSDSQLYKQAGNSIVVNVLMAIFKEMI